ncbi:MAG TPA: DUF2330 domain-containing protein [Polyangiaceae bacterium]|nr:DUF2330 domain-containing protein [Polyangiaceae bacterium]
MNRSKLCLGAMAAVAAMAFAGERRAEACGGCIQPPGQMLTDITDERMLLAVSGTQSTLYDQIEYSGSPSNFAWVLPIHGTVTVGLSADVLFDSIDSLTTTTIQPPAANCPVPTDCNSSSSGSSSGAGGFASGNDTAPVTVLTQANVGPYETVQLQSTDGSALETWLTNNGYAVPAADQPILDAYAQAGFNFLAMKLLPGQGVQAMRPVRISTPGASLTLPLRMASIGTGAVTGITVWIVADGRYEPQNFPFFHIEDSQLVWDFAANLSNYTTLRTQAEAAASNATWEIESSIDLNEQIITNTITGGRPFAGSSSGAGSDPSVDYLPSGNPDAGADGGYETAEEVRGDDINALFVGMAGPSVRVTRVRSDIAQTAMTKDIVFQASSDQSELSNFRNVTQSVNLTCPIFNGCEQVGTGTPAQAAASIAATGNGSGSGSSSSGGLDSSSGSGDDNGAAPPSANNASGGGCATSAGNAGSSVGFAAILAVLGLFFQRTRRRTPPNA